MIGAVQVTTKGLTKIYEPDIVGIQNIDLEIRTGPFGLLGPNGAGKTTLMRVLATLLAPTEGTATIKTYDIRTDQVAIRRMLGYLPEQFGLYPNLTAWEFLDYLAILHGIRDARMRRQRIERALSLVNLLEVANRKLGTFSHGMRQRVGIAQGLLHDPQLLILDEPTAGLDPEQRVRFRGLLSELSGDRLVILSTHIVGDVEAICRDMAIIHNGQVVIHASPQHLTKSIAGKVWVVTVPETALSEMERRYQVMGIVRQEDGLALRLLADEPPAGAEPTVATLEDAYLYYTRSESPPQHSKPSAIEPMVPSLSVAKKGRTREGSNG